jgi:hypothetical protein
MNSNDGNNDSKLCYQFVLHGFSLNITESVIKTLTQFVETSGFVGMDLTTVATMIQKLSHDGLITKTRFDIAVERILSIPMRDIDRINNAMILSSIFYAFDRTGSDVVDTVELTCGLAVICEG